MACIRIRFVFVGLGIWLYLYLFVSAMVTMATWPPQKSCHFPSKNMEKRPKKLIFFQIIFVFANILLIWILSVFESICWPWYLEVFVSVYLWGTGLFAVSVGAKKYSFLALSSTPHRCWVRGMRCRCSGGLIFKNTNTRANHLFKDGKSSSSAQ